MAQISYTNKVALNENPEIADINKVTDDDMNEIKQVVNDNYNNTIQVSDTEPTDSDNKLWIDTGEVSSSASEITNSYSTSTGLGYSANYINNLHTYSTDEIRVGTWTDGKPLYRKTFTYNDISQITSGSFATINTGLANANIVKFEGVNYRNDLGISRMLPYNDVNDRINILSVSQGQGIRIYYSGTFATSADNIVITIYYTKN